MPMSVRGTIETLPSLPAERYKRALEWMDKAAGVSPEVALAKDAALWLTQVDLLREQEDVLLDSGDYDRALPEHRVLVSSLIAEGERIALKARKAGISKFPSGFTLSDFEAALDSVRLTFRCQHAQENTPAVKDLIAKLINAPESAD